MYGLRESRQKYYVEKIINRRTNKKFIARNDNNEMLTMIANNLIMKFPVVRLNKDIENKMNAFDTLKDLSRQKDTLHEMIINELEDEVVCNELHPERNSSTDTNNSSETQLEQTVNDIQQQARLFNIDCNNIFNYENGNIEVVCVEIQAEGKSPINIINSSMTQLMQEDYNIQQQEEPSDKDCNNANNENENIEVTCNEIQPECNSFSNINSSMMQLTQEVNNIEQQEEFSDADCNTYGNEKKNNDSDYCYSESSDDSEEDDPVLHHEKSKISTRSSIETSLNSTGQNICDDTDLQVKCSNSKGAGKTHFCYFCKKLQSKISRHLERVHKNEDEVKKFAALPKGNKERQKIIALLRRKGNFLYNTDAKYNNGELIVCRRPTECKRKTARDFTCCAGCKGFFTKNNLRHHFKECTKKTVGRSVKILGRKVQSRIHERANSILRNIVFPVLREDDIIRLIRYDELLILYGNKLCIKYQYQHQQDMIRSRLRLLGRFFQSLKTINKNVTDFFSVYHPSIYDDCVIAVNQVAGFNADTKIYAAPSVASRLGTLLKQIGNMNIAECIKRNKLQEKVDTENFLKLLQEDFNVSVNKIVEESILQTKRRQVEELPPLDDIKLLHNYLLTNRRLAFDRLSDEFTYNTYRQLAEFTLISIQLFNRRRAGEIERIYVDDYKHQEGINESTNPDLYTSLSADAKIIAAQYVRFTIRGKLGRSVPVLLDCEMKNSIDLLLKYRKEAKIPEKNPYIFALPGYDKRRFKYIRACELLRTYSLECKAKMPLRLRGTKLRKHIATSCITLNLSEHDIIELANHLGHEKSIHMRHYRQAIPQIEIVKMSRLLRIAQGEGDNTQAEEDNRQIDVGTNFTVNETYQPENMDIDNIDDSDNNSNTNGTSTRKKKRSTSPYGSTKRVRWTQEERDIISTAFRQEIKERRLPSGKEMVAVKMKNKSLDRRSIPQIRSWIHNQISKESKS